MMVVEVIVVVKAVSGSDCKMMMLLKVINVELV